MFKMCYQIDCSRIVTAVGFAKVWCRMPDGMVLSFGNDKSFYDNLKLAYAVWLCSLPANRLIKLQPTMLTKSMKVKFVGC